MRGRASLGWSLVLRVAPPLIAEELKSVLGTWVPPPLSTPHTLPLWVSTAPGPLQLPQRSGGGSTVPHPILAPLSPSALESGRSRGLGSGRPQLGLPDRLLGWGATAAAHIP